MVARKAARLALNLTSLRPSVTAPLPLKINWFFYFSCLASIGLDTSAPIFHWNHMESATFDWSITFVERWIFRSPPQTHTHWHNTETRIECTNTTLVSSGKDLHCWRYGWYWWHCPYCCTAITYVCLWLSPPSLRPLLLFLPVSFFGDPPEVEEALRLKLLLSCHLMMDQPLDHLPTLLGPNTPLFQKLFFCILEKVYLLKIYKLIHSKETDNTKRKGLGAAEPS